MLFVAFALPYEEGAFYQPPQCIIIHLSQLIEIFWRVQYQLGLVDLKRHLEQSVDNFCVAGKRNFCKDWTAWTIQTHHEYGHHFHEWLHDLAYDPAFECAGSHLEVGEYAEGPVQSELYIFIIMPYFIVPLLRQIYSMPLYI